MSLGREPKALALAIPPTDPSMPSQGHRAPSGGHAAVEG